MTMVEAMARLRAVLWGLGFYSRKLKSNRANAQRRFVYKPRKHRWITVVIWTTVSKDGPLPNKRLPIQILLFGNKLQDRFLWIFTGTRRFRKDKVKFRQRLRHRAELAKQLSESVHYCPHHTGVVTLKVNSNNNNIDWCCTKPGCEFRSPIDPTLSKKIAHETPKSFWRSKMV